MDASCRQDKLYIIHLFEWNFFTKELHYDFINIFCGYFIFFLILFLCKKKHIVELIKFVFKYISINCMKYCTMYYPKFLSELHLMHVNW